jgi:epoxyqueuosine reductase
LIFQNSPFRAGVKGLENDNEFHTTGSCSYLYQEVTKPTDMSIQTELTEQLNQHGVDFIRFVDITTLPQEQNKGFPYAILFGITLTSEYIQEITNQPDYIQQKIKHGAIHRDEFHLKEKKTDRLADELADFLTRKGFTAYSQSEENLAQTGSYNEAIQQTSLPHKTIAHLAGMGWMGKHDLLVTPEYGSAISMCTVLTDAPLESVLYSPEDSKCGDCQVCVDACATGALKGKTWDIQTSRDEIVNIAHCTTCLRCLAMCPWTQRYAQ